jgi:hypothetical protein
MVNGAGCDRADACVMDSDCEFYVACLIVVADGEDPAEEAQDASGDDR